MDLYGSVVVTAAPKKKGGEWRAEAPHPPVVVKRLIEPQSVCKVHNALRYLHLDGGQNEL